MKKVLLLALIILCAHFSLKATDYYWVGGSGNWSDLSHWATTSGGSVNHAQIPTSEDDVIFDANSFSANGQTVTMNNDIVFFKNMDWTGITENINFSGGRTVIMNAFGSLDMGSNVNLNYGGTIIFTGDNTSNTINYGNNTAGREMYFAGGGVWTFQSDIVVDSIFQIDRGSVVTNNRSLRCQYFYIQSDATKALNLGSSDIEIWGRYGDREFYQEEFDTITAKINTTNLNLISGTSTINFTANLTEVWFTGTGSVTLNDVIFSNGSGKNYIRPFYGDPKLNYNNLTLRGSTRIEGIQNMNSLALNRKKIYRFESGRTYNIGAIDAIGTCAEGIVITASDAGVSTTIASSGTVDLDFVTLRDINGSGATFNATNSTDLGNNNNWSFTNSNTLDFYWIGGTGDWDDPAHWSLTSGGPSSGCVPAGKDNAHFDTNSFTGGGQVVTVNVEDIFIRNMMWNGVTGNPEFTGDQDYSMHITGSLRMDANMQHTFGGYYFFESSESGNTIEMNSQQFNRELHFSGQSADWSLLDDIYVRWNLDHNSGTLVTNGHKMDIFKYQAFDNRTTHLDMSGSYVVLHDVLDEYGNAVWRPEWYVNTENYTSVTDNSTIEFQSVHYCWFFHEGPNRIEYNNLIFSSYGADISGYNWTNGQLSATTIDSCIIRLRGQIFSQQVFNYLELTAGFDYAFGNDSDYYINELNANGTCEDGHITINSISVGRQSRFHIETDHIFERLIVQDINNQGTGTLTANTSKDQGNNVGWVFNEITPRVLYWVNNGGEWEDPNHWSLTSGGPGGECVPTSIDDVIFDENSFTSEFQWVVSDNNRFITCHNMTWINVFGNPNFGFHYFPDTDTYNRTDRVKIHGSLRYDPGMVRDVYWHHFATNEMDSVESNGIELPGIQMLGYGNIKFLDELTNWSFDHNNGSVDLSGIRINTNYYNASNYNDTPGTSDFTNSKIHLGREYANSAQFTLTHNQLDFLSDNSVIYLKTSENYIISNQGKTFNRVVGTNPQSISYIADRYPTWNKEPTTPVNNYQSIRFVGDGYILGNIQADSLIGAAGKTYTLETGETQIVNRYLQLIGNNCTPIQLRSDQPGTLATLSMPQTGKVVVDFIEMRDNNGTGGAEFIAGARSTNIAMSNVGWLFEDPPEYVETGFLGPDRALCNNATLELNAFNFSPNETYSWSDMSSDTTLMVANTGTYSVTVTFDNGCMINDEIIVLEPQDVNVNLQPDTIICEGTTITLNGSVGIQGVTYLWDDNVTGATRDVSAAGTYNLTAEVDGCISQDEVTIEVQETPTIDLGVDQSYCEGETFTLMASYIGANYMWQDGSSDSTFTGNMAGIYWAEAEVNLCTFRDSIVVDYVPTPPAEIGNDTTLCEGTSLNLNTEDVAGATITWQDGTVGNDFTVSTEGPYVVNVDINGCINRDSIYVTYQAIPTIDLGENQVLCEGTPFTLDATTLPGSTYTWQDGADDPVYMNNQAGTFTVMAEINNCSFTDEIEIAYVPIPPAEIGSDTTLCVGQTVTLNTEEFSGAIYTWQDGTTGNTYNVTMEGPYKVRVDNLGCIRTDSIYVTYQDAPDFELGETIQACEADMVSISTQVMADNYQWNTGETTPEITVTNNGTYSLIIQVGECYLEDSLDVIFNAYPNIDLGPQDTSICDRESLVLSSGQEGIWQDGSINNMYTVSEEGKYKVILDNNGCESSDSINVSIIPLPDVELGDDDISACVGDLVILNAPSGIMDFQWENTTQDETRNIFDDGIYWIEATENGCSARDSVSITFFDLPTIDLGRDTTVCDDTGLLLTPANSGGTITWEDGSTGSQYLVNNAGLIRASIENNGCFSMDSVFIAFRECNYFDAYIPNVFSPNEDGNNDTFLPVFQDGVNIVNYSMKIFDRWGNLVFSTTDLSAPWNGQYNQRITAPGVYVYVIELSYNDDRESGSEIITGDVLVLR